MSVSDKDAQLARVPFTHGHDRCENFGRKLRVKDTRATN